MANVRSLARSGRIFVDVRTAALTVQVAFVFDNRMTGYGAEPTPERPIDDAYERGLLADLSLMR